VTCRGAVAHAIFGCKENRRVLTYASKSDRFREQCHSMVARFIVFPVLDGIFSERENLGPHCRQRLM